MAHGDFASREPAAEYLLATGIEALSADPEDDMDDEELVYVRGLLDAARAQVARGEYSTLKEVKERMAALRDARRSRS